MMKSQDTASFLFGIAKRGRKYYLGLSTITQDVNDFLQSPYGAAMITNSSIQLLLRQSPTSVDLVQSTFKLSDEEKYLLLESDVGEGIFFAGLKHVAIKVIASYTEDQIITSDPSQILAIKKAKQELAASQDTAAPAPRQSAADILKAAAMKDASGTVQQAATESLENPLPPPPTAEAIPTPRPSAEEIISSGHRLVTIGATPEPDDPLPPPPVATQPASAAPAPETNPDRPV